MEHRIKEILIIAAVLIASVIAIVIINNRSLNGNNVIISVDDSTYGTYSLYKEQQIVIESSYGINVVEIKDGAVRMLSADCPNQLCVKMRPMNEDNHDSIVCLPHKVIVEIK